MNIKLSFNMDSKRGLWYLGAPRPAPKLILSSVEPGPIDVNFKGLTLEEQAHVLNGIQRGDIMADMSFDSLYQHYVNSLPPEPEAPPEVKSYLETVEQKREEVRTLKKAAKESKKEDDIKARCASITKQSVKALKYLIRQEQDIRVLRTLLVLETQKPAKKQRASIVDLLNEKIRAFNGLVAASIEHSASLPPVIDPYQPRDTINLQVEDDSADLSEYLPDYTRK